MRRWILALLAIAAAQAWGQATDPAEVAPDLLITVREHPTTAEIVEATARDHAYTAERMRAAAERLGARTGSPPRGLDVKMVAVGVPEGRKLARGYFATDNLIDREKGTIDLTSIVQAFCEPKGDPPVKNLAIILDGERPVVDKTPKHYRDGKVWMRAAASDDPPSIEVRVSLQTDSLEGVAIPTDSGERPPASRPADQPAQTSQALLWALVVLAGLAGGALVYSLLARRPAR